MLYLTSRKEEKDMLEKIKKLLKLLEKHESLVTALINFITALILLYKAAT